MTARSAAEKTQFDGLQKWVGRTQESSDLVSANVVAKMAAALDHQNPQLTEGSFLPLPWHWLFFTPTPQASATGQDGHPKTGDFLPPVPLPRRMWAGSKVEVHQPLQIGDKLTCTSTVESVVPKSGRQGELVFVSVAHRLFKGNQEPVLTEIQDIVYRAMPTGPAPVAPEYTPELAPQWSKTITPDPVMLFRYSALTFNGHRIHYDRNWAVDAEGYPGLVVHGPLIATLLIDLMYSNLGPVEIARFTFRGVQPLFDLEPFTVNGARDGNTVKLWALTPGNQLAMSLEVELKGANETSLTGARG
ncbi:FAS1-like dehydratase domain-containing protein [Marinobacter sediminicola]|uniref:FAS1-like dehydratase domain-containing protein n=1 Tax=Marinobacter sediminicola TaxID=3072994 RepID=UPI002811C496|nr:MaoC family dehydratase N-terminal domain-containing protein [Marinobacter sp. F26243]